MSTRESGVPGSQGLPGGSGTPDSTSQNPSQGQGNNGVGGGQGTGIKYKAGGREFNTAEEMQNYINTLTTTVREQGRTLNDLASRAEGVNPGTRPNEAQGGPPARDATDAEFWKSPTTVLRQEMERLIEPFRRDLAQTQQLTAIDRLRTEFASYGELEPMIDSLMTRSGQPRTYENLRATYFMVKGYLAEQGVTSPVAGDAGAGGGGGGANPPSGAPPQHRPSSAPLPTGEQPGVKKRALTEHERRIARISGYTDEQYLALIELDEEEVATTKIGREAAS
jgi:hypothetical protein